MRHSDLESKAHLFFHASQVESIVPKGNKWGHKDLTTHSIQFSKPPTRLSEDNIPDPLKHISDRLKSSIERGGGAREEFTHNEHQPHDDLLYNRRSPRTALPGIRLLRIRKSPKGRTAGRSGTSQYALNGLASPLLLQIFHSSSTQDVGGWYIVRVQYSSLGEGAAVVSLGAVDMEEGVQVRVQVG